MQEIKIKTIPRNYYRIVLKGNEIIAIYTDDGVSGGVFWDVADKSNWGKI
jgi:hypothetical protein